MTISKNSKDFQKTQKQKQVNEFVSKAAKSNKVVIDKVTLLKQKLNETIERRNGCQDKDRKTRQKG